MLAKLKNLLTGERQNLETGELVAIKRHEHPDPTPIAAAIGYKREPSLHEKIAQMVRSEKLAQEAAAAGFETEEEANDFDVDDPDYADTPSSPHEFDKNEAEVARVYENIKARQEALEAEKKKKSDEGGVGGTPPTKGASAPVPAPETGARKSPTTLPPDSDESD